jgi:hypothetical protein
MDAGWCWLGASSLPWGCDGGGAGGIARWAGLILQKGGPMCCGVEEDWGEDMEGVCVGSARGRRLAC